MAIPIDAIVPLVLHDNFVGSKKKWFVSKTIRKARSIDDEIR